MGRNTRVKVSGCRPAPCLEGYGTAASREPRRSTTPPSTITGVSLSVRLIGNYRKAQVEVATVYDAYSLLLQIMVPLGAPR
jgi:hypothetical protein